MGCKVGDLFFKDTEFYSTKTNKCGQLILADTKSAKDGAYETTRWKLYQELQMFSDRSLSAFQEKVLILRNLVSLEDTITVTSKQEQICGFCVAPAFAKHRKTKTKYISDIVNFWKSSVHDSKYRPDIGIY